ncbi:hypothetical protein ACLB2K_070086 [Fragaria x ananassa]
MRLGPPSHQSAQEKSSNLLLWALRLSSSLNSVVVSLSSVELAHLLVSHICWANHVLITWKLLEKALTVKIVPPWKRSPEMVEARMRSPTKDLFCHSWRLSVPSFKKPQLFPSICIGDLVADSHATATTSATNIFTVSADLFIYQFVSPVHDNHNQSQLGKNWLMLVEEGKLGKVFYPSRVMQKYELEKPNLLDFRVFELARVYRLYSSKGNIVSNCKAAMSLTNNDRPELMILATTKTLDSNLYELEAGLHRCNLGFDDRCTKLTYDPVTNSDKLVDIICHRGKFYAVAENGRAIVIDPSSSLPEPVTIADPVSDGVYARMMKLIESSGELLLVETRPVSNGFPAKVFKLNTYEKRWVKIEHLKGRQVLFVGDEWCFSMSSRKYPGLMHDCIYYYDSVSESISPLVFDLLADRYLFLHLNK